MRPDVTVASKVTVALQLSQATVASQVTVVQWEPLDPIVEQGRVPTMEPPAVPLLRKKRHTGRHGRDHKVLFAHRRT